MTISVPFSSVIGNIKVPNDQPVAVVNPATTEPAGYFWATDAAALDEAFATARQAFPAWRDTPLEERREALHAIAEKVAAEADRLASILTLEQGKPLASAKDEILRGTAWMHLVAEQPLPGMRGQSRDGRTVDLVYQPLGVVSLITAWNTPITLACRKVAPTLLTGNCAVLKPSPFAPLTTLEFGRLANRVLPAGVLNVVACTDEQASIFTDHPFIDKISFTGSTQTGRKVLKRAAANMKSVTLELGGNDAAMVLEDADLEAAVPKIFRGAFFNSGQVCIAVKRLYVHDSIFDEVLARLSALVESARLGNGVSDGVEFGPIQNDRQFQKARAILEDARHKGYGIIAGQGPGASTGHFMPLTLVVDPPDEADAVRLEAFAPILPVMRFSTEDELVARVNASEYGLGASVWCTDPLRARRLADRIDAGTVWINECLFLQHDIPFSGRKDSGYGVQYGEDGLKSLMKVKAIYSSAAG